MAIALYFVTILFGVPALIYMLAPNEHELVVTNDDGVEV